MLYIPYAELAYKETHKLSVSKRWSLCIARSEYKEDMDLFKISRRHTPEYLHPVANLYTVSIDLAVV